MTSIDIAKEYKKEHKDVLDGIRIILKKNPELESHFEYSTYINSRNRSYPMYILDMNAYEILKNKYKFNIRNARFEYKICNEFCDFFDGMGVTYFKQYCVGPYRIDLYVPLYNIAIEFDEEEHRFKIAYDKKREQYIINEIKCKFIRINETDSVGRAISKFIKICKTCVSK